MQELKKTYYFNTSLPKVMINADRTNILNPTSIYNNKAINKL